MKTYSFIFTSVFLCSSLLCSCASDGVHRAACNKLKSQIVFSGATSDTRQAEIERSERFLQQRTYDDSDCSLCYGGA